MSQITTHILDTSAGIPAVGVPVSLLQQTAGGWTSIATGETNESGRITDLLPPDKPLAPGTYKLRFDTESYFTDREIITFYPFVEVAFIINDETHYHVPLLLSPFGYSTYRGT